MFVDAIPPVVITLLCYVLYEHWKMQAAIVRERLRSTGSVEGDERGWCSVRAFRSALPPTVRWSQRRGVEVAVVLCRAPDPSTAPAQARMDALPSMMRGHERGYRIDARNHALVLWGADDSGALLAVDRLVGDAASRRVSGLRAGVVLVRPDGTDWSADALLHAARDAIELGPDQDDGRVRLVVAS